jgi:hypothetical protein
MRRKMANTRKDHKALMKALKIEPQLVLVSIPNGIAKRMRGQFSKGRKIDPLYILAKFHPKLWIKYVAKLGKK